MREMIYALSIGLFGRPLILPKFPDDKNILGKGMSDWDGYAIPLANKLNYLNTFYDASPKLDITSIDPKDESSLDFLLSTDVFEHVVPPVSKAFENAAKLLKPNGIFIFSVPYTLDFETVEHFPYLNEFTVEEEGGERVLINKRNDGQIEKFSQLIFHGDASGGGSEALEMRVFSENSLLKNLKIAGFNDVRIMREPFLSLASIEIIRGPCQ
jgi:SAM-dependent methyltransferase